MVKAFADRDPKASLANILDNSCRSSIFFLSNLFKLSFISRDNI